MLIMKKIIYFISAVLAIVTFTACEQDLPVYNDETARLNFVYETDERSDTTYNYSFVYHKQVSRDTVWMEVETMGFLSSKDRYYTLYQVATGDNDAVPGVHYVSFDDAAYKQLLVVPADSVTALVPIIVINDASLTSEVVKLKVKIGASDDFQPGYNDAITKILSITNQLQKPSNWNMLLTYYLGNYGPVKHQFMIDVSGKDWDEEYITEQGFDNMYTADQDYLRYLQNKFSKALAEENARRVAQGLGYLAEEDGTLVSFSFTY